MEQIKLIAGSSSVKLTQDILHCLSESWGEITRIRASIVPTKITKFADGEIGVDILESTRGQDVTIIQSTCNPVSESYVELLLLIDALKRAATRNIMVVMPYMGFSRADKKVHAREPISAALFLQLLKAAGATSIMTMDLHAEQTACAFDGPFDILYAGPIQCNWLKSQPDWNPSRWVAVSPDVNGAKRAELFQKYLGLAGISVINKERPRPNESRVNRIVGDVEGYNCLLIDDMIDTGGSIVNASDALTDHGALKVVAMSTHAVYSGGAANKLQNCHSLDSVVVMDTIPLDLHAGQEKTVVLSSASIFATALRYHTTNRSVSSMFKGYRY